LGTSVAVARSSNARVPALMVVLSAKALEAVHKNVRSIFRGRSAGMVPT
jgi:hypothetical protein